MHRSGGSPGDTYGAVQTAEVKFGSGGAGATSTHGTGGGAALLSVAKVLLVEGTIEASGADGLGSAIGGGSGGCIIAKTRNWEGSGNIVVSGGAGGDGTGAGGGGRIAVFYEWSNYWFGSLDARGGSSSYGNGGAGTVYLQDMTLDAQNKTLIIDNFGVGAPSVLIEDQTFGSYVTEGGRTWITDSTLEEMNHIRIVREANLAISPNIDTCVVLIIC